MDKKQHQKKFDLACHFSRVGTDWRACIRHTQRSRGVYWWRHLSAICIEETSQELRMLSSVTINCQVTKIVMNSGSQLRTWIRQNCSQCLKCHKSLGLLLGGVLKMCLSLSLSLSLYLSLSIFLVLSCFLITLNKCRKGHKSLGSLCNVKSKSTLSQWLSESAVLDS